MMSDVCSLVNIHFYCTMLWWHGIRYNPVSVCLSQVRVLSKCWAYHQRDNAAQ